MIYLSQCKTKILMWTWHAIHFFHRQFRINNLLKHYNILFSIKVASFSFATDFFSLRNFFLNWITQRMPPRNNQSLFCTVDTVKSVFFCFLFSSKTVSIYEVQISSISHSCQKLHCYISIFTKSLFKAQKPISLVFKFRIIFSHAFPLLVCFWNH